MNAKQEAWVKALRSGEYKQTKEHLRDESGFCCLGVACDLFMKETGIGEWVESSEDTLLFRYPAIEPLDDEKTWDEETELPQIVRDWLGVASFGGEYYNNEEGFCLAQDNDSGKTFQEIADIIESEPDGLFVKDV